MNSLACLTRNMSVRSVLLPKLSSSRRHLTQHGAVVGLAFSRHGETMRVFSTWYTILTRFAQYDDACWVSKLCCHCTPLSLRCGSTPLWLHPAVAPPRCRATFTSLLLRFYFTLVHCRNRKVIHVSFAGSVKITFS